MRGAVPISLPADCPPLTNAETGRGVQLPHDRLERIQRFCADALKSGATQDQLRRALRASRSRVSRWCHRGLALYGEATDHRLLKKHERKTLAQMMWARIDVGGADACWPWRGALKPNGYGSLNYHGTGYNAHRLAYETLVEPVPPHLVVDHKCSNKACCNPRHLHVVGQSANVVLAYVRRSA